MVWYSHLFQNFPQFIVIHIVKGFGIVNKAKVDVFLELCCFLHDPADVGNLMSGSPAFSETSFNIREFPAFPSHLKRRRSPQERREELQRRATIPRVPQMSQSIPGKPVFPALPLFSSRGSIHTTVERGTALWESLVGKPRGKASRESHIP